MEVRYSDDFRKSAKKLAKRYKSLKNDLKTFTNSLKDNPRQGTELFTDVYKIRVKNSDNNKGKSAGYRIITYLITQDEILLVNVYSKSDISNLSDEDINMTIKQYKEENENGKRPLLRHHGKAGHDGNEKCSDYG
jgi:mRNA-degrading endonuclease RelE of RelBE toxin-antitoxin system